MLIEIHTVTFQSNASIDLELNSCWDEIAQTYWCFLFPDVLIMKGDGMDVTSVLLSINFIDLVGSPVWWHCLKGITEVYSEIKY